MIKQIKVFIILILSVTYSDISFGQESSREFGDILHSYYLYKDKDIADKTIDFVNNTTMDYSRLKPIFTGFFGALFLADTSVRVLFTSILNRIDKPEYRELFNSFRDLQIDSFYSKADISPSINDMNWSSYFATGNIKYLDNIISNIIHGDNRSDINLFLTGATAKWSLCSNARQDKMVERYLVSIKDSNKLIKPILENDPQFFRDEMTNILKDQKSKGIWE